MSKNNKKFQHLENPREAVEAGAKAIAENVDQAILAEIGITKVTTEVPNREGVPVEERRMSFEEYRRQGIPPQYRGFFFNGR